MTIDGKFLNRKQKISLLSPIIVLICISFLALLSFRIELQFVLLALNIFIAIVLVTITFRNSEPHPPISFLNKSKYLTILLTLFLGTSLTLFPTDGVDTIFGTLFPAGALVIVFLLLFATYTVLANSIESKQEHYFGYGFLAIAGLVGVGIVWSFRYSAYFLKPPSGGLDDLAYTFSIWIQEPITSHFLLTWEQSRALFENKMAYHSYPFLYSFLHYVPVRLVSHFLHWSPITISRMFPVIYTIMYAFIYPLIYIKFFRSWITQSLLGWLLLAGVLLVTVTLPVQWNNFPPEHYEFLFSFSIVALVSALYGNLNLTSRSIFKLSALFGILFGYWGATFSIILAILACADSRKNTLGISAALVGFFGVLSYSMEHLFAKITDLSLVGSTWAFRSGLDGGATDFPHFFGAIFNPKLRSVVRPESLFWIGGLILIILFIYLSKSKIENGQSKLDLEKKAFGLFALVGPYLINGILIPQSYSHHPNFYDTILSVPMFAAIPFVLARDSIDYQRLKIYLPWIVLFLFGIINHNLVMIARIFKV